MIIPIIKDTLNHMGALQNKPEKVANFFIASECDLCACGFGLIGGRAIIRYNYIQI
jgi:hypothetical protein